MRCDRAWRVSWGRRSCSIALLAGACTFVPGHRTERELRMAPDRPCALAVGSCALPYPSHRRVLGRRSDQRHGSAHRDAAGRGDRPSCSQLGPGATIGDAFEGADGFSAITPIVFEFDRSVIPWTLPDDGGDVLAVFDAQSGERVPIRAEVPAEAVRHGDLDTMVVAWPRTRYEYGRTYVARLTRGVRPAVGDRLQQAPGMPTPSSAVRARSTSLRRRPRPARGRRSVVGDAERHPLHGAGADRTPPASWTP